MKPVFIALLHNLMVTESLGSGDKIKDTLRITNDRSIVVDLVRPDYRQLMGEMEFASLFRGAPVVFAEQDIPANMTPQQYLLARLYEVQTFLMTTWVIRDNAINCEMGFLLFAEANIVTATSNFLAHLYSTAKGENSVTTISREQLREMCTLHREAVQPPDHPFLVPTSQLTSAHPRVSRAIYLVNAARGVRDIAMKVAHYCTAFETLFATSPTELAHQLSERVACYLYQSSEDRLAAYRHLKAAYALRSKVVHGSTLREKRIGDAIDTSEYCDQVARQLFRRLLTDQDARSLFERSSESFDKKMLRLIFGGSA